MTSYKINPPTIDEIKLWLDNQLINPRTNKKIKKMGPTYNILQNKYFEYLEQDIYFSKKENIDRYVEYRKNKIDPILLIELPYDNYKDKHFFKFKYKWDPYTGERLDKDDDGPLYFDPDSLIYYFYLHRLKMLWNESDDGYHGFYGDAIGNGPDFYIKGRGHHPEWYLFRLPINDCYLSREHNNQYITIGPILTDSEILEIDRLSKNFGNNYYNIYKKKRPNLFKIKQLYEQAISKQPNLNMPKEIEVFLEINDPYQLHQIRYNTNIRAVDKLSRL